MVVGARIKEAGTMKFLRVPAKWFIRKLAGFMTGHQHPRPELGDARLPQGRLLEIQHLLPPGHSWVSTITLSMLSDSHTVNFMPIDYFPRKGKSTFHPIKDTANYFMLIFRTVTWFNPLRLFLPLAMLLFLAGAARSSPTLSGTTGISPPPPWCCSWHHCRYSPWDCWPT